MTLYSNITWYLVYWTNFLLLKILYTKIKIKYKLTQPNLDQTCTIILLSSWDIYIYITTLILFIALNNRKYYNVSEKKLPKNLTKINLVSDNESGREKQF